MKRFPTVSRCIRCRGAVAEDRPWDLPARFREYCCVNCGNRYWLDLQIAAWIQSFGLASLN